MTTHWVRPDPDQLLLRALLATASKGQPARAKEAGGGGQQGRIAKYTANKIRVRAVWTSSDSLCLDISLY